MSVMNCFCLFRLNPSPASRKRGTQVWLPRWLETEARSEQLFRLVANAKDLQGEPGGSWTVRRRQKSAPSTLLSHCLIRKKVFSFYLVTKRTHCFVENVEI